MNPSDLNDALNRLALQLEGELLTDEVNRIAYSTDASVYQVLPVCVVCPRSDQDIATLIRFASRTGVPLIPRAAGTSLAGQVVGDGIVVDVTRHMNRIVNIDRETRTVRVQPGVVRDELNRKLVEQQLFFGPETSTSNRATIGGMLGNNSCGANSIVFGSTRDQTVSVTGFTGAGEHVVLQVRDAESDAWSLPERQTLQLLEDPAVRDEVVRRFPTESIQRRNTGYALDRLVQSSYFQPHDEPANFAHLIAGSEGTLLFVTEVELQCHALPPNRSIILCPGFDSVADALRATQAVSPFFATPGEHGVYACELIDHLVLEGAARNPEQQVNRNLIAGDPRAVLLIDIQAHDDETLAQVSRDLQKVLEQSGFRCAAPGFQGEDRQRIWQLRKAGLGVVANVVGDAKPATLIEDVAVSLNDLPDYIGDVDRLLESQFQTSCVHYGHAGAGELHLRPVLDLKTQSGRRTFREIGEAVSELVTKYRGALSGEHGDGRLRSEFIADQVGDPVYQLFCQVKQIWDPEGILNPGKIANPVPMDRHLRFDSEVSGKAPLETVVDFEDSGGIRRAAEMCSGSGDCRKSALSGGVMCPSFQATRDEQHSTRARANVLRQVLKEEHSLAALADERIHEVMELCLSCKGCKRECPSNVDISRLKAEARYRRFQKQGVPLRARLFCGFDKWAGRTDWAASVRNRLLGGSWTSSLLKRMGGVHANRSLPKLAKQSLRSWFRRHKKHANAGTRGSVILFCDEFTNRVDVSVGIATVELLEMIGYEVQIPEHLESGRVHYSSGRLDQAAAIAEANVKRFHELLEGNDQLVIGVEPSALLMFRDEYPVLVSPAWRDKANRLSARVLLVDEFISRLIELNEIDSSRFVTDRALIRLHGHCHQKALSSMRDTIRMLQLPANYSVKLIPAGCCGMAGMFGYEKEHYDLSMKIGELQLFPAVRAESTESVIAAGGTSCRQQIEDGTGRNALHPVEVIRNALIADR